MQRNPQGGTSRYPQHRQNFAGKRPVVEPVATQGIASALKVKNFRALLSALGDDVLALALDLNLPRIEELSKGFNFSNETAHYIELTLGLASGFMDQVNPVLPEELVERIKAGPSNPIEEEEPEPERAAPLVPIPPLEIPPRPAPKAVPPKEPERSTVDSPANEGVTAAAFLSAGPREVPVTVRRKKTLEKVPMQNELIGQAPQADASAVEESQREVRRLNLTLLTQQPGTKSQLARITGLSAANISHRLHGVKLFDDDTAVFFCEQLGLPVGWFDVPRSEADIPAEVLQRLMDKTAPLATAAAPKPAKSSAPRMVIPTGLAPARAEAPAAEPPVEAATAPRTRTRVPKQAVAAVLASQPAQAIATPPAVQPVAAAAVPSVAVAAPPPPPVVVPAVAPAAPVAPSAALATAAVTRNAVSLDMGGEVGPIAEALIRTLAVKSRQGKMTESKALELLNMVVAI
jgi:hypothetical protein